MRPGLRLLLVVLLAVLVRAPFWAEALRTPLDGDEAIIGLMAQHLGRSPTIWGQSFGSPLEPALVAPFVVALGPTVAAVRLPYFLLGILLVVLAYYLAGALDPRAALPAALIMACPAPYLLIIASLATIYPSALVLCGLLLLLTFRIAERLELGQTAYVWLGFWGGLAGLAIWTHLMTASVVAAALAFLCFCARGRVAVLLIPAVAILAVTAPWWSQGIGESLSIIRLSGPGQPAVTDLGQSLEDLGSALGGLLGTRTPLIADDASSILTQPLWLAVLIVLAYGLPLAYAVRASRRAPAMRLMLAVIALVVLAFPFPHRSGPHTIRYLTIGYLALVALTGFAVASLRRRILAWAVVVAIVGLNLTGAVRLFGAWHRTDRAKAPFLLPDLTPVLRALEARGIRRAYASYGPAYRLTYESGERIIVSPPWNERFRHRPLPLLDEVRFAKNVAWILTPTIPSDLPTPERLEEAVYAAGGRCDRILAGPAIIYCGFVPPFGPTVEAWPGVGPAGDGDLRTSLEPDPISPTVLLLPTPRRLDAVTLVAPFDGPRLPRGMTVEVSTDGVTYQTVTRRWRRGDRQDLRWINGHPQAVIDHDLIAVPLGGRAVAALRITADPYDGAWSLGEVLLHPAVEKDQRAPWDEWLDPHLSWIGRARVLARQPRVNREDWYWRMLLASRTRSQ